MSEMPANNLAEVVKEYKKPPKMRSVQEITAKYNQALEYYKELCFKPQETNQLKLSTYAEIKALGWVLGKPERVIIKDIAEHSASMPFGIF
ncbi:MAG: hypothetical protein IJT73_01615 [Selenomonadaceae bacterium]|nr:hypothetical protein [Selenomonadaceae bacterium]